MPRDLFDEQNALSGTVLLRELTSIMDAHISWDGGGEGEGEDTNGGVRGSQKEEDEGGGGEDKNDKKGTKNDARKVAAFTGKRLASSRKYGGTSILYHGEV